MPCKENLLHAKARKLGEPVRFLDERPRFAGVGSPMSEASEDCRADKGGSYCREAKSISPRLFALQSHGRACRSPR